MTDKLPPNLLALFAPRPPLRWVPPSDHPAGDRKTANITGVASFLPQLAEYKETDKYEPTESWLQKRDRIKAEKKAAQEAILKNPAAYKPDEDPNIRGDAFKTLIVARLSYDANDQDIEREFSRFGPIERIRIVVDTHQDEKPNKKKKKHRGYAFVVFEREKDMRAALENCDGIRIKDRRIKVDVQRAKTVRGWLPRRLGGGLGGRGYTKAAPPRPSGPGFGGPSGPGGSRGGGGGFRGGFDRGRGGGGFRGVGNFQDRGGYGGGGRGDGGRGGIGYPGSGFSRGGGYNSNVPANAPAGPQGGRGGFSRGSYGGSPDRNGFGDRNGGSGGGYSRGGGDGYSRGGDSRSSYGGGGPRPSGSNNEPVRPRDGHRDGPRDGPRDGYSRDSGYDRPREDDSRKRQYEGSNGYEDSRDPRKLRRY